MELEITTDHPSSNNGQPVFITDPGRLPVDYAYGLTWALKRLGWNRYELADSCGKSKRTVDEWWQGRPPPAAALNVVRDALNERDDER